MGRAGREIEDQIPFISLKVIVFFGRKSGEVAGNRRRYAILAHKRICLTLLVSVRETIYDLTEICKFYAITILETSGKAE
jgi:hypothetical protein